MERFHSGDLIAIRAQAKREKKRRGQVREPLKMGSKTPKPIRFLFEEMARQGRSPAEFERKGLAVRVWLHDSPTLAEFQAALVLLGKDWGEWVTRTPDPLGHVSAADDGPSGHAPE